MTRVDEIKEFFNSNLSDIDKCENSIHKCILIFSLLDTFVEHNAFCKKSNGAGFIEFIGSYSNWKYRNYIDFIQVWFKLSDKHLQQGKHEKLKFHYESLDKDEMYPISKINLEEIDDISKYEDKDIYNYKYVNLLYKFRSKLVHELRFPSFINKLFNDSTYKEPFYVEMSGQWYLIFPYYFIKELTIECVNKYLTRCEKEDVEPINNYKKYRDWYEQ